MKLDEGFRQTFILTILSRDERVSFMNEVLSKNDLCKKPIIH